MESKDEYETYPDEEGNDSLTAEERETVISWSDDERDKICIYSTQQPMIRKLLKNPLFECEVKTHNKAYKADPISVKGLLPRKCLTLRTKLVKRNLTDEQRNELRERLKNARDAKKH